MKTILRRLLLPAVALAISLAPATAMAFDTFSKCSDPNADPQACVDCSSARTSAVCSTRPQGDPITGTNGIIMKITNIVAIIAGVAAVVVIIVGGLKYVTADGDSNALSSAKNTVLYALIGLVVIVVARTLIAFVISKL